MIFVYSQLKQKTQNKAIIKYLNLFYCDIKFKIKPLLRFYFLNIFFGEEKLLKFVLISPVIGVTQIVS